MVGKQPPFRVSTFDRLVSAFNRLESYIGINGSVNGDGILGQGKVYRLHVDYATKTRLRGRVQAVRISGHQRSSLHP